jgi:hypothetical protein
MSFRYWRSTHIGALKNAIASQGDGDAVILWIWLVAMFAIAGVLVMAMR